MSESLTHLVVNWIDIDKNVILVGATDNLRWKWDTEIGMSGHDAKTIAIVTLTDNGKGYAVSERAEFFCSMEEPTRFLAMSNLTGLFEIAWIIKKEKLTYDMARDRFFGKSIGATLI